MTTEEHGAAEDEQPDGQASSPAVVRASRLSLSS